MLLLLPLGGEANKKEINLTRHAFTKGSWGWGACLRYLALSVFCCLQGNVFIHLFLEKNILVYIIIILYSTKDNSK